LLYLLTTVVICGGLAAIALFMLDRYAGEGDDSTPAATAEALDSTQEPAEPEASATATPRPTATTPPTESAPPDGQTTEEPAVEIAPAAESATSTAAPTTAEEASAVYTGESPTVTPARTSTDAPDRIDQPATTTWRITARANVNIRACPATSCEIVVQVGPNERIEVLSTEDDWHAILLDDGSTGYVATFLTAPVE